MCLANPCWDLAIQSQIRAVTGDLKGFLAGPEQREEDTLIPSLQRISWQQLQPGAGLLGDGTASVLES